MAVDLFLAAAPAALSTCAGMALGYFVYKRFVKKWYGDSKNFHTTTKIKYWLGVLSCFSIAQGFTLISGEFFYVAFNESSIRGENIYKGIHTFIILPLILSAIGFFIGLIFGKPIKESYKANDEHYAEALRELENKAQVDGLWARCLANSEGNDSKAKSEYIRIRAIEISQLNSSINNSSSLKEERKIDVASAIRKQNNSIFFGAAICIAITLGIWVYFISFRTNSNNELGNLVRSTLNINQQKNIVIESCESCTSQGCEKDSDLQSIDVNLKDKTFSVNYWQNGELKQKIRGKNENCSFSQGGLYNFQCTTSTSVIALEGNAFKNHHYSFNTMGKKEISFAQNCTVR